MPILSYRKHEQERPRKIALSETTSVAEVTVFEDCVRIKICVFEIIHYIFSFGGLARVLDILYT
ncbi:hypothetical protein CO712_16405 [Burkholderia gladioli pv. gladioli]|nr:hypothetical protein CO712_16405 [Burkholderia gladioli pv. gladioli]